MKNWLFISMGMVLLLALIAACAPQATPVPTPAQVTAPATATPQVAPPSPPEDLAWQGVLAAAKTEGKVALYTFGFTGDVGKALVKVFGERFGIQVELISGVGAVLIERIRSEHAAKKYIADLLDTSVALVAIAKNDGLTASAGFLPSLGEKETWSFDPRLDPDRHVFFFNPLYMVPYINTTLVKAGEEPRSYRELLDPKWKGKVIVADPNTVPFMPRIYAIFVPQKRLDDDYFRRLAKHDIRLVPNVRENDSALARGEAAVAMATSVGIFPMMKEGAPVKPVEMNEGSIFAGVGIAPVKNAPHPNAARVFLNWFFSAEGQRVFGEAKAATSIRKDVPDFIPPQARLQPKEVIVTSMDIELETARLQREKVVARLMGLEK